MTTIKELPVGYNPRGIGSFGECILESSRNFGRAVDSFFMLEGHNALAVTARFVGNRFINMGSGRLACAVMSKSGTERTEGIGQIILALIGPAGLATAPAVTRLLTKNISLLCSASDGIGQLPFDVIGLLTVEKALLRGAMRVLTPR